MLHLRGHGVRPTQYKTYIQLRSREKCVQTTRTTINSKIKYLEFRMSPITYVQSGCYNLEKAPTLVGQFIKQRFLYSIVFRLMYYRTSSSLRFIQLRIVT